MSSDTEEVRDAGPRRGAVPGERIRRRSIRSVLAVPFAIVSTIAVTLGIAQPAEAAAPLLKRHAKPKAQGSLTHDTAAVATTAPAPAEFLRDGAPVPELHGTAIVLADAGFTDAEALEWLIGEDDSLGTSPIAALRAGRKAEVRRVAQALA